MEDHPHQTPHSTEPADPTSRYLIDHLPNILVVRHEWEKYLHDLERERLNPPPSSSLLYNLSHPPSPENYAAYVPLLISDLFGRTRFFTTVRGTEFLEKAIENTFLTRSPSMVKRILLECLKYGYYHDREEKLFRLTMEKKGYFWDEEPAKLSKIVRDVVRHQRRLDGRCGVMDVATLYGVIKGTRYYLWFDWVETYGL